MVPFKKFYFVAKRTLLKLKKIHVKALVCKFDHGMAQKIIPRFKSSGAFHNRQLSTDERPSPRRSFIKELTRNLFNI